MDAYFDRLRASARSRNSLLCVGLDPSPDRIPGGVRGAVEHCRKVVRQTAPVACVYKPNLAFWEQYGREGWVALLELRESIPEEIPVLIDAKRGDVPETMRAYARALFEVLDADAVTASPYLGADSLSVFADYSSRGTYVLCRTSNPGAADLQDREAGTPARPLYLEVAELTARLDRHHNLGLVVGATAPEGVQQVRSAHPELPFLIPGVGPQGGDLAGSVRAAWTGDPASCLVGASRSVMYARDPEAAAQELVEAIRRSAALPH